MFALQTWIEDKGLHCQSSATKDKGKAFLSNLSQAIWHACANEGGKKKKEREK